MDIYIDPLVFVSTSVNNCELNNAYIHGMQTNIMMYNCGVVKTDFVKGTILFLQDLGILWL